MRIVDIDKSLWVEDERLVQIAAILSPYRDEDTGKVDLRGFCETEKCGWVAESGSEDAWWAVLIRDSLTGLYDGETQTFANYADWDSRQRITGYECWDEQNEVDPQTMFAIELIQNNRNCEWGNAERLLLGRWVQQAQDESGYRDPLPWEEVVRLARMPIEEAEAVRTNAY